MGGIPTAKILHNIKLLHRHCHECRAVSVAITIPESAGVAHKGAFATTHAKANSAIMKFFEGDDKTLVVDMCKVFPFEKGEFWDMDGLHFSPRGYEEFGRR